MRSFSNLDTVKLGALTRVTNQEINFSLQIYIKFPIFKHSVKPETCFYSRRVKLTRLKDEDY